MTAIILLNEVTVFHTKRRKVESNRTETLGICTSVKKKNTRKKTLLAVF